MKFIINETADMGYSPYTILLDDTKQMNEIADIIQKQKGELPLFDDSAEYNADDWYNFYLDCDVDGVKKMWFEYGMGGDYCDEIELTEIEKVVAFETVCDFFGGLERYRDYIEEYEGE